MLILVLLLFFIAGLYIYKILIRPGHMKSEHFESEYYDDCVATNLGQEFPRGCVIFLGNSLLVEFPMESIETGEKLVKYAIRGTFSDEALNRLDLLEHEPRMIVIGLGINDLLAGFDHQDVLDNMKKLVKELSTYPSTELVCLGLLPVSFEDGEFVSCSRVNKQVLLYNEAMLRLSESKGFGFVDMHPKFVDEKGTLKSELTYDGVHLTSEGYQIWTEVFSQIVSN